MVRSTFFLLFCSAAVTLVGCGGSDAVSIGNSEPTSETLPTETSSPSGDESVPSGSASASADDPTPTPPDAPKPPEANKPKRVFITAQSYKGNLRDQAQAPDGFQAGDKICQTEAKNLGGTWKAFLSGKMKGGQDVKASDRLNEVGAWYLVDGTTKVFEGKAGLASAPLAKIDMLADGKRTTVTKAWTGTKLETVGASCEDMGGTSWASSSIFKSGTNGNPLEIATWVDDGRAMGCAESAPLYCFEQ